MTPQTFKMESFAAIISDFQPLTTVAKFTVVDILGVLATPQSIEGQAYKKSAKVKELYVSGTMFFHPVW